MEVRSGSCRFGLWAVNVWWSGGAVHQVRFSRTPIEGAAPVAFSRFLSGRSREISGFTSTATLQDAPYAPVYEAVSRVPYGSTLTYGEIGALTGHSPRVVGLALMRNPTPIIIPCHRITSKNGIGGFTPAVEIKDALLALERRSYERHG
jgi:methylated-DNA-[protein]-cysteine S-methyltransferase